MIAAAEKLCAENARAGDGTKNGKVEDKNQLIDDGDTGHLLRADPADHDIIQQTDKIGDAVLNHDGDGNGKDHFIEGGAAEVPPSELRFHRNLLRFIDADASKMFRKIIFCYYIRLFEGMQAGKTGRNTETHRRIDWQRARRTGCERRNDNGSL